MSGKCSICVGPYHIEGTYEQIKAIQKLYDRLEKQARIINGLLGAANDLTMYRDETPSYRAAVNKINQLKDEWNV